MIEITNLFKPAEDAAIQEKTGEVLGVDNSLRCAAVCSIEGNLDSFFGLGHNYLLCVNPTINWFHFIPWDLDQ